MRKARPWRTVRSLRNPSSAGHVCLRKPGLERHLALVTFDHSEDPSPRLRRFRAPPAGVLVSDLWRDELPFALLVFGCFLLVSSSCWAVKPIKKSLFIEFYDESGFMLLGTVRTGARAEPIAKVLNMGGRGEQARGTLRAR